MLPEYALHDRFQGGGVVFSFHLGLINLSGMIVRECRLKNKQDAMMAFSMGFAKRPARQGAAQSGAAGEDAALAYLLAQGLVLVERNFRARTGEIDLIMADGNTLVFVEVRKRSGKGFGGAAASVTPAKQQRLARTAQLYLQKRQILPACRFDVVAIDGEQFSWLKNVIETE